LAAWGVLMARVAAAATASLKNRMDIQTPQAAAAADTLRRDRTGPAQ
jgi:hypothetical protein